MNKSLLEQWKNGEIPEDFYYTKASNNDEIDIRYIHNGVDSYDSIECLVPSYEEYKILISKSNENCEPFKHVSECGKNVLNQIKTNIMSLNIEKS